MKLAYLSVAMAAMSAVASASTDLRRDSVVKVTFDNTVSMRRSHEGDRFSATVSEDQDLPRGTQFLGHVAEIHRSEGRRPAYMDLRFEAIRMPNGQTYNVKAVPVRMDYVRRDSNGRFRVDQPKVRKENYVLGGLLGGTLLGSILHKPFEGAFVGVLAGILVGESSANDSAEGVAVQRGQTMGVLIQEDVRLDDRYRGNRDELFTGRGEGRNDDPFARSGEGRNDDPFTRGQSGGDDPLSRGRANNDDDPFARGSGRNDDPLGNNTRREPRGYGREAAVTIDEHSLNFAKDQTPFWVDKVLMVPIKRVAGQVEVDVDEANNGRVLYLSNEESTLRIEQGERNFRLNGRRMQLSRPVEVRNGVLYGPIDLFSQMHLGTVRINGTKLEN